MFGEEFQELFREAFDQFTGLGTRKEFNKEKVKLLESNSSFTNDLRELRGRCDIPDDLESKDDFVPYGPDDYTLFWLETYGEDKKTQIEKGILNILEKYDLPPNFKDWVQWYLFYNEKPSWLPLYDSELLFNLSDDPELFKERGLTTGEKKMIKMSYRKIVGVSQKGSIPKEFRENYKKLLKLLSECKNRKRKYRTLETALQAKDAVKKFPRNKYKSAYNELSIRVYDDDLACDVGEKKLKQRLRKQKERLKKRTKKKE